MPNFMLLGQKTSELGGGIKYALPRVWSAFKSPGKIELKTYKSLKMSLNTGFRNRSAARYKI